MQNRIAGNRFKFVVIDQHHQHIGGGQRRVQCFASVQKSVQFWQPTDIRFDDQVSKVAVPVGDTLGELLCRAFAQIVDIRLKGQPKTGDFHRRVYRRSPQSATAAFT